MSDYGYCPICGGEGVSRMRCSPYHPESCTTTCENKHTYLSKDAVLEEKAPPGWKGTVAAMKKHPELSGRGKNPYALAWYMKNKGDTPHYKNQDEPVKKNRFAEWLRHKEDGLAT